MKKFSFIKCTLCSLGFILSASPVLAAELEEIVVTAQRKAETLLDVPLAVSALSQEAIEGSDTHELGGIAVQVPGLTFSSFSPGQNIVALRGASSNDDGAGTDGSVAIFVDDVYLGRISNINPELFDLERIEVLRGPQGTLYGKNTIGGAINIVSTRPDLEKFSGKVKLNLGNYSRVDAAALVTGPLANNLAFKVSASVRTRDGWVRNRALSKHQKDDNARGLKGQLLYSDDVFEALVSFDYNDLDIEDMGRVPLRANYEGIGPGGPNPALFRSGYELLCGDVSGINCVAGGFDGYAKREAWGLSGRLSWTLSDTLEFLSITAYRDFEADWNMDSTGHDAGNSASSPPFIINDDIFDTTEQFSQEFRLIGSPADRVDYVVGLWYLSEETDRTECFDLDGTGPAAGGTLSRVTGTECTPLASNWDGSEGYRQVNETTSYALFGQIDIRLTPRIKLTLGGRYSSEEKKIESSAFTNEVLAANPLAPRPTWSGLGIIAQNLDPLSLSESWSAFTPRVSLSFELSDDATLYLTYSEGFKSGGFGAAPTTEADARKVLDQEEATNYEVGFKGLFGGVFRLGAAAFLVEYDGLQYQNFGSPNNDPTAFGRFLTFNAGDGEVMGIEVEATLAVDERLTLGGFLSWQNSEFGTTNIENAAADTNQDGNDLLRTPELKYGFNADYSIPLPGGSSLTLAGSYSFTDDQRADLPSYAIQPAFELVDLRLTWTTPAENFAITGWMKNALDEEYIGHIYTIAGGSVTAIYGDPFMYGVSATFSW